MDKPGHRGSGPGSDVDQTTARRMEADRRKMMRLLVGGFALVAIVALGLPFGFLRATIAVALFLAITIFGSRQIRSMVSIPPEPDVTDVSDYGLKYVCEMCGLELKVEVAAKDRAPTHCMEPMKLVRTGGKPPLRPVD
ncbi:MAG: hypothetical protein ACRDLB_06455 [Actinomycetota bacterium]